MSFYAVLEFKNLKDTEAIFSEFGQGGLNELSTGSASQWTSQLDKKDGKKTVLLVKQNGETLKFAYTKELLHSSLP